jgi:hypothetical protein
MCMRGRGSSMLMGRVRIEGIGLMGRFNCFFLDDTRAFGTLICYVCVLGWRGID